MIRILLIIVACASVCWLLFLYLYSDGSCLGSDTYTIDKIEGSHKFY